MTCKTIVTKFGARSSHISISLILINAIDKITDNVISTIKLFTFRLIHSGFTDSSMFLIITAKNIAPTYPGKENPVQFENFSPNNEPTAIHNTIIEEV